MKESKNEIALLTHRKRKEIIIEFLEWFCHLDVFEPLMTIDDFFNEFIKASLYSKDINRLSGMEIKYISEVDDTYQKRYAFYCKSIFHRKPNVSSIIKELKIKNIKI